MKTVCVVSPLVRPRSLWGAEEPPYCALRQHQARRSETVSLGGWWRVSPFLSSPEREQTQQIVRLLPSSLPVPELSPLDKEAGDGNLVIEGDSQNKLSCSELLWKWIESTFPEVENQDENKVVSLSLQRLDRDDPKPIKSITLQMDPNLSDNSISASQIRAVLMSLESGENSPIGKMLLDQWTSVPLLTGSLLSSSLWNCKITFRVLSFTSEGPQEDKQVGIIQSFTKLVFLPFASHKHISRSTPSLNEHTLLDQWKSRLEDSMPYFGSQITSIMARVERGQKLNRGACVLIAGSSGSGKSSFVRRLADLSGLPFLISNFAEIVDNEESHSEQRLEEAVALSQSQSFPTLKPSLWVIDDVDCVAAVSSSLQNKKTSFDLRIMRKLLQTIDQVQKQGQIVIATTSRPELLDVRLCRSGRFDHRISLALQTSSQRSLFISQVLDRSKALRDNKQLVDKVANITTSLQPADLSDLCRRALSASLRRSDLNKQSPESLQIEWRDFEEALAKAPSRPSALRELNVLTEAGSEGGRAGFEGLGGLDQVKEQIRSSVIRPFLQASLYDRLGARPPSGLLLYGSSGCGKTALVQALVHELPSVPIISVNATDLISKIVGESEQRLSRIFQLARSTSPCILFIDHVCLSLFLSFCFLTFVLCFKIEAIASNRSAMAPTSSTRRLQSVLLTELDGVLGGGDKDIHPVVYLIGVTSDKTQLDPAILRPGRLDHHLKVPEPNHEARLDILHVVTRGMPLAEDVDLSVMAERTALFSGADLSNLCREAALISLRENIESPLVCQRHLLQALKSSRPSLTLSMSFQSSFSSSSFSSLSSSSSS